MPPDRCRSVVVIGGGTGSYTALVGLKHYTADLTAIVSMMDDGGSSGRLRDELGHLPAGDVRRCLLALSSDTTAGTLRQLFEYRFDRGIGLNGHSFGNLFLSVLTELTGATDLAIKEAARLLGVRGQVIPVTLRDTRLHAELEDGTILSGETRIDIRTEKLEHKISRVFLDPVADANPDAIAAIERADAIVIGPGDLYTSVVPNLLVTGIGEAIGRSRAVKIYVCNLMTKHGETDGYGASDFVAEVQRYLGNPRSIDHVIVNDGSGFPADLVERYRAEHAVPVESDLARCEQLGPRAHLHALAAAGTLLRHDPDRLARIVMAIVERNRAAVADRSTRKRAPEEAR